MDSSQVPGGAIEESEVLQGVMINKDVTHAKMKRRIENPRIILLDCNLEYKKGESQVCHVPFDISVLLKCCCTDKYRDHKRRGFCSHTTVGRGVHRENM